MADSVQAMRYLDIGSNKPSAKELAAIPHHMVNIHDPGDYYSAGEYCQDATKVIVDILQRGKVPLVVGGNTMVSALITFLGHLLLIKVCNRLHLATCNTCCSGSIGS